MNALFRFVVCLLMTTAAAWAGPTTAPAARRVMVISIDGLRPDLLLRADTPTLHGLLNQGSFTFWAQTTSFAVTTPSHVSMMTGARPLVHGIEWDYDLPLAKPVYPKVPTLFELAHKVGFTTGMVAGKSKFDCFEKPGTLDYVWVPTATVVPDREVLAHTLQMIWEHAPQVMFVHLPQTDTMGHAHGWASPQQMAAIHNADGCIGEIIEALRDKQLLDSTLLIISADHGGAGKSHGPDDVRSRNIPWIAVGPNVRPGIDLTLVAPQRTIRTEDTFATTADFLGLPINPMLDGRPVEEIYDRRGQELLSDASGTTPTTQPVR